MKMPGLRTLLSKISCHRQVARDQVPLSKHPESTTGCQRLKLQLKQPPQSTPQEPAQHSAIERERTLPYAPPLPPDWSYPEPTRKQHKTPCDRTDSAVVECQVSSGSGSTAEEAAARKSSPRNDSLSSASTLVPTPTQKITLVMKVELLDRRIRVVEHTLTYPPPQVDRFSPSFHSVLHQNGLSSHVLRKNDYWDITVVTIEREKLARWLKGQDSDKNDIEQPQPAGWKVRMPSNNGMEWAEWVCALWGSNIMFHEHERTDERGWLVGVMVE
ncbi:hypothetical protein BDZ91DRAFT_799857 [Kalaharituber pfeilii]|nr:hypothetical protein BDZ91DRAFT_799857 [Kalaharituber pfeilii]